MERFAKIVATLGPACTDEAVLRRLIEAGMNVARLNFSHGTHEEHARRFRLIRRLAEETGHPVAILQDLQGPKMRIGNIASGSIELKVGQVVLLAAPDDVTPVPDPDEVVIPFDVPEFSKAVQPGGRILLDDGNLEMEVVEVLGEKVRVKMILGGKLSSHKGVNLPGAKLNIPCFTEKDKEDLDFGLEIGVDLVAISFVRTAEEVREVRNAMRAGANPGKVPLLIAKLERPEALENLDAILEVADGVMVARGDLGVEMSPAAVPIAQKKIIEGAARRAKIVITATQMLDSMISNPRPTRAEASDVANAVFDGTDAVMLSGETAAGKYPIESVMMMDEIVREAEKNYEEWGHCEEPSRSNFTNDAVSITRAAREMAHDRNVAAIAVFTQTGHTALWMSKERPNVPILAFTPHEGVFHQMSAYWGTTPILVPYASTVENMLEIVESAIIAATSIQAGQQVVLISGFPVGHFNQPNFALLHTIGKK
ncbi:MAG TPA: pyruvate kinase [Anaerolineaceae bacterium]|nr:pyruvate kinase [Anaerolineaceae bacterium]HPN50123.1 pyruvate kinase [Anaerolineaceae bacterium]